mgnify:CR=1 FL=1
MNKTDKQLIHHIHRIQGQLDGVEKMIAECRACDDVVMQLMAIRSSVEKLSLNILRQETKSCLKPGNRAKVRELDKIAATLFKYT